MIGKTIAELAAGDRAEITRVVEQDDIAAFVDAVGSQQKDYIELPGGHISLIAGRGAATHCWPKVSGWLAPRSGDAS